MESGKRPGAMVVNGMRMNLVVGGVILGVVGLVMSFIPFICLVGIPIMIVGFILFIYGLIASEQPQMQQPYMQPPGYPQAPPPGYGAPPPAYGAPPPVYQTAPPPQQPMYGSPPQPAAVNCRYCGSPVPPGSVVCPRCGGRL